jgi:hypothetical protein
MYVDIYKTDLQNYEWIFNMTGPDGGDPTEGSLFNIQTL